MLRLILGPAGSGKTALITDEIRQKVTLGQGGIIMLVPEQYSFEAERELCRACPDSLSLYAEVLSFSRLAVRVFQETGTGGRVSLDNGGRLLCMSLAISQIGPQLKLYRAAKNKAELQEGLLKAVLELKAACISSEALCSAAENAEASLSEKLRDLALCLESYDAVLSHGKADPTDRLARLAETVAQSGVGAGGPIYIDGFTDFTGVEMQVLSALLRKGADMTVCLSCDGLFGETEHFEPARRAANALLRIASEHGVPAETVAAAPLPEKTPCLRFFDEKLFSYTAQTHENPDGALSVIKCACLSEECEMAASKCLWLVRETGCRFSEIAIAARGFDAYSATLSETFRRYGVPLFTARRGSILTKPVPALIGGAFEILDGGWALGDVLSYMKTGLTGLSTAEIDTIESYAVMWNLRGAVWHRTKSWTQHPLGFGLEFDESSRAKLAEINALRLRLITPLKRLSESTGRAETAALQARALADFLTELALPETLAQKAELLDASGQALLAAEYVQLWDIVLKSLEQINAILGQTPMTRPQFSKLFLQTLAQYDVSAIPVSADSVSAGEMDRMRRRHIRHLIILGASDENLPRAVSNGGLFSPEERDEMSVLGLALGGGADELSRELGLIYNCVTLPSQTLTLSYSGVNASGAQTRPSFLISRAKLLFSLEEERFLLSKARLSAPDPAFLLAADALRGKDENARLAYAYFAARPQGRARLRDLSARAGSGRGNLSGDAVNALYGNKLSLSPSRTDAFSACRYAYFLRYGLKLDERERAGFEAPELGSFMHFILENVAGEISRGAGFKNADEALTRALVGKHTERYVAEKLSNFEDKSPRFVYLFNRLRPAVENVACDMVRELSKSDFAPLDFELGFLNGGALPPVQLTDGDNTFQISGIADRVDGYFYNDRLYLRVIDYKTGKKAFSLTDVWYGMGMQMLIYLFALETQGKQRYGKEIVPAGVLYVPARDALISASGDLTDEELRAEKMKKLRRSGLILDDAEILCAMERSDNPEYLPVSIKKDGTLTSDALADTEKLALLHEHVDKRLTELAENLSGGSIEAQPYYKGESENACLYCPYMSVCRFDEGRDRRRYLQKVKPEEFWNRLGAEK